MSEAGVMGHPCADLGVVDRFAAALRRAGFTTDGIEAHLGAEVSAALTGGVSWPAAAVLADDRRLSTLIALFLLGEERAVAALEGALSGVGVDELAGQGIVAVADGGATVRPILDVRPYADDAGSTSSSPTRTRVDARGRSPMTTCWVSEGIGLVGAGGDPSTRASRARRRHRLRRAGVAPGAHCADIVATDTNDRALALAAATARASGQSWDLRRGSLFEPVAGERFDLIVSNPPFVISRGDQDYIYRDSGCRPTGCANS